MEMAAVLVISEIMYNPASTEQPPARTEWVEMYNPSETAVALEGWYLEDEDGRTGGLPAVTVQPGEAVVVAPEGMTAEAFAAAWGEGFQVVPVDGFSSRSGMNGLANAPSDTNEVLTLRRPNGSLSDEVNYDDKSPWPKTRPDGASIYLLPGKMDPAANDDGSAWGRSESGVQSARHATQTSDFDAEDVGSPGVVVTEEVAAKE